jgi:hypothetical protein
MELTIDDMKHPSWIQQALDYVTARRNPDGGYNFCQGVESCAQDTYYALAIFNLLDIPAPNVEATVEWLQRFPADNIYAYYYVAKGLAIRGEQVSDELVNRVVTLRRPHGGYGVTEVGIEAYSEFEATYRATEILRELHVQTDKEPTIQWLLGYLNTDGGFGVSRSNIISTFHAVASLHNLDYPVKKLDSTLGYIRSCEKSRGGFTAVPEVTLPFLEDIHAGVSVLGLMGEECAYPEATRDLVLGMQNSNGGFRRSIMLGLSTFEDTYYALSILKHVPDEGR